MSAPEWRLRLRENERYPAVVLIVKEKIPQGSGRQPTEIEFSRQTRDCGLLAVCRQRPSIGFCSPGVGDRRGAIGPNRAERSLESSPDHSGTQARIFAPALWNNKPKRTTPVGVAVGQRFPQRSSQQRRGRNLIETRKQFRRDQRRKPSTTVSSGAAL